MFNSIKSWLLLAVATVVLTSLSLLAFHAWNDDTDEPEGPPVASVLTNEGGSVDAAAQRAELKGPNALVRTRQIADPLPPVDRFPIRTRTEAAGQIDDEEFVLGVVVGSEARAYPLNMLADPKRELLNDTLGGQPIAIAWCDQCQCPRAFSRVVAGKTLTFSLTGETLGSNMIFQDRETGSEWVQLLGKATAGPFKGERLPSIPAVWIDWKTWQTKYPETTVLMLSRVIRIYRHVEAYSDFEPERAYFGKFQWGLEHAGKARSWPFAQLARQTVVNDEIGGTPIVVVFDRRQSTATAFERVLDGQTLTFRRQGTDLVDEQSNTAWDPITGEAMSGPHLGRKLKPVAGIVSKVDKWLAFHPETEVWTAQ
jgi:hypothetical protein